VSFFHLATRKTNALPRCRALDGAPDHLITGHGRIWSGRHWRAMGSELPCFTHGQPAHGQADSGLGLARLAQGAHCTLSFIK
jgi:hypothetical protein